MSRQMGRVKGYILVRGEVPSKFINEKQMELVLRNASNSSLLVGQLHGKGMISEAGELNRI
jgi:hypothetical protein